MKTVINIFHQFYLVHFFMVVSAILYMHTASSQYNNLVKLNGIDSLVYYSEGHEQRAKDILIRTKNAIEYNYKLLGFKPEVTVLVLSPEDWAKHTTFPVYGMPHYKNDKTLIVASSDNDFWKSFIPPVDELPAPLAEQIKKVYRSSDGTLSMQPFFDLLALHELGHAFHIQGNLKMQRKWMGELFCNILLHNYIAENEPHQLPALTVFPEMVVHSGTSGFTFTTLDELENNYSLIAQQHPKNYGWYQGRLHVAAKNIYDAGGSEVMIKLWNELKKASHSLNDNDFAHQLQKHVHSSVSDVMLKW